MAKKVENPTRLKAKRRPILIGFLTFLMLLLAGFFMLWQRYQILLDDRQSEMAAIIGVAEQNIDQSLKYSYSAALSLALQIDEDGKIENFDEVAPQLVDNNPNIDAIEIVPDGIITKVYPYEKNKDAINYNILKDSTRNGEAFIAIERKRMFFAGPLQLRQGGLAIIGRLPVFKKNEFWGFVAVLIHFENLVDQSGLEDLAGDEFRFQFSKINPVTKKEEFFLNDTSEMDKSYSEKLVLPDGDWKIYIIPVNPYEPFYTIIPVAIMILIISGALGWIVYNSLKQPAKLQELVKEQAGELAKSELHFRTIFNQAAIGMARVNSRSGMILEANKKFQDLLGYSEEELKLMDYKVISHPDDLTENSDLMRRLSKDEIRQYSLEKRLERKDGTLIWVRINVSPLWEVGEEVTSHIALVEDISARVKAKQRLVDNENRFRSLVENSNEIILIVDDQNRVKYYSPSLAKISKYEKIDFAANGVLFYIHPEDHDLLRSKVENAYTKPGVPISDIVLRVKDAENNWFWVNATLTNMLAVNNVNGFVINLRDITGKKEAEVNLVKSYELVMEQNKRLLNFAYIVSHNLRSHSSNMSSILELYDTEESQEEKDTYVHLLRKVSKNLDQSLHDLNEVVSINTNMDIKAETVNVSEFIDQALDILSLQMHSKRARVINEVPEEMQVSFNSAYMESVLLNFLTNALRYSDPERSPIIELIGYKEGKNWVLVIKDNGIGIDLDKHGEKVFGLYKTFSDRKDSRGVGLFITKNQINAMGGTVKVESETGVGTSFKVTFK
ncbi:PAS domain S-box protein [Christiangramia sp. SM2212]|uniref:histidine kinase n=1 Tax=Christiangramia sediminicola TaxID=3073267 RepID=A0ABU1ELT3_9FLAO|nr:PAS domain S-box protein [Christiangramia sp. SM2212]MDR5589350.1 PAS domain S-box protein [Christiangramia sp. SM2212]